MDRVTLRNTSCIETGFPPVILLIAYGARTLSASELAPPFIGKLWIKSAAAIFIVQIQAYIKRCGEEASYKAYSLNSELRPPHPVNDLHHEQDKAVEEGFPMGYKDARDHAQRGIDHSAYE